MPFRTAAEVDVPVPKVLRRSFGKYSGPVIRGTVPAFDSIPTMGDTHLDRAFWLTTMVESGGKAGSVMMADGTAVTAALEQLVAVYPRQMSQQGSLFKMLRRLDFIVPIDYYLPFDDEGWFLGSDGVLRVITTGKPVRCKDIRDTLTPTGGQVPERGKQWNQAKQWAIAFHRLFALPITIPIQIKYGHEQLIKFGQRHRSRKMDRKTVEELAYRGEINNPDPFPDNSVNDLAMAMWWNYKVNAPSPAMTRLKKVADQANPKGTLFGELLLKELRTARYGRWATNRYDRSRQHAMEVWPNELFEGPTAVMPERRKK